MGTLTGKVAVVLGASAKNGIGWACAQRLAGDGATVVVGARSYDRLKSLADPVGMLAVKCDAGVKTDIAKLADTAIARFGRLDIAVNSAGLGELSLIADADEALLLRSLNINFIAMVNFVQIMAHAMGPRTDASLGSIVLVSTVSVNLPMQPVFSYAAAKGATDTMVRYAALEYGPQKIKVNTINPGLVITDLARNSGIEDLAAVEALATRATPLRRLATPADCADAVSWLAGSGFVSGLHLNVCGGGQLRAQFGE
jgi:NAD(P)-dependent dehydrogenase (short-subunit alcohol dehydrogenase family)